MLNHQLRYRALSDLRLLRKMTEQDGELLTRTQCEQRFDELTRARKPQPTTDPPF